MSSQIKFRIWDTKLNKYIPWESLLVHDFDNKEYEYEQFTGLTDKDGKEIYEGDILKFRSPKREYQTHHGETIPRPDGKYIEPLEPYVEEKIDIVEYFPGCFRLKNASKNSDYQGNYDTLLRDIFVYQPTSIKELREYFNSPSFDWWQEDLEYLLNEYNLKTEQELLDFINKVEIIGNVKENPDLVPK